MNSSSIKSFDTIKSSRPEFFSRSSASHHVAGGPSRPPVYAISDRSRPYVSTVTKPCKESGKYLNLSVDILTHMLILFVLLSLIFWLFISKIATKSITDTVNNNLNDVISNYKKTLSPTNLESIRSYIKSNSKELDVLTNIYSTKDPTMEMNNDWLLKYDIVWIGLLTVSLSVLLTVVWFSCNLCVPILHILGENLILFMCVGVVEFLFFYYIALQYVPTSPSVLLTSFVNKLKSNLEA